MISHDFGRSVASGAHLFVIPLWLVIILTELLRQAKVCQLGLEIFFIATAGQHYVLKLYIAMNNLVGVEVAQRSTDLKGYLTRNRHR